MKTFTKKITLIIALCSFTTLAAIAQEVTPSLSGVKIFCTGSTINLGALPADTTYLVTSSTLPTTRPDTATVVTLADSTFNPLQTGYYYIMKKGTALGSCLSEAQEVPIYVLAPISVDFTGYQFCAENGSSTTLTGTVNAADPNVSTYAYQWYTVSGGTETAIPGATSATYTVSNPVAGTTYLLRAGYLIGGNKYCGTKKEQTITITTPPAKPTLTITAPTGSW